MASEPLPATPIVQQIEWQRVTAHQNTRELKWLYAAAAIASTLFLMLVIAVFVTPVSGTVRIAGCLVALAQLAVALRYIRGAQQLRKRLR